MTAPHEGGVIITLADIYKQMVTLTARVDTTLARQERTDQLLSDHELELRPLASAAERLVDHESRLRSLERTRWPIPALTVLIALGAGAVALVGLFVK